MISSNGDGPATTFQLPSTLEALRVFREALIAHLERTLPADQLDDFVLAAHETAIQLLLRVIDGPADTLITVTIVIGSHAVEVDLEAATHQRVGPAPTELSRRLIANGADYLSVNTQDDTTTMQLITRH